MAEFDNSDFMSHGVKEVETPMGTPSPPGAASTVARPPPRPRRFPLIHFPDDDINGMIKNISIENSSVSFTKKHDTPRPSPDVQVIPDRSSLGILLPEAMVTATFPSNNNDESLFPPKPLTPELDSPCNKDDSAETVIPKVGLNPKYLTPAPVMPNPDEDDQHCVTFDSTILEDIEPPSGIFFLEMTKKEQDDVQQEFASLAQQQDLEFQPEAVDMDFEEKSFKHMSGQYQSYDDELSDDFAALAQQQAADMQSIEFEPINEDISAQIAIDEKENEVEHQFMQEEVMVVDSPSVSSKSTSDLSNKSEPKSESMSDFFKHGTSNLGISLGSNSIGSSQVDVRPNFGFSSFDSPKSRQPVPALSQEKVVAEAISLSQSKYHDLTAKQEAEMSEIAKLILQSSPGHDAKYYAELVLKKLLEKEKQELESTLHVTQFMPSFLDDSSEMRNTRKLSVSHRHSSPKKANIPPMKPKRIPFGNITNKVLEEQHQNIAKNLDSNQSSNNPKYASHQGKALDAKAIEFPVESNRLSSTWVVFGDQSQNQIITLRNRKRHENLVISLLIRNDDLGEFSFAKTLACDSYTYKGEHNLDVTIGPSKARDITIAFKPASPSGESRAQLVIKPHGFRIDGKKNLKSTVQLHAMVYEPLKISVKANDMQIPIQDDQLQLHHDKSVRIHMKNEGQTAAFFKCSFLEELSSKQQFVLSKGQEKRFKLNLPFDNATLVLFFGPEVVRQIFKSCHGGADHSFLLRQDFKCYFDGEKSLKGTFNHGDMEHFFTNIHREVIKLSPHEDTFVPMHVEEASSASVLPSACQSYESELVRSMKKKDSIYLQNETVHFPAVKVKNGTSVAKVTIKNRTDKPAFLTILTSLSGEPFENYYQDVTVKPFYYLSIPIRFRPVQNNQQCTARFTLKNVQTGQILSATLVGCSQFLS